MSAVVQFQPAVDTYGSRSLTAADVRAQVNLMQDVMAEVMRDGTHYGTIPGTKSKSLYKAGAEKLMATFRLAAKPEVEDLSEDGEIAYRVTVNLLSASGAFIGAGIGECSSAEEKYSWRASVHAKEWQATPGNRRRVKFFRDGREVQQVRTNPADVANTILKMAKKRAQVDAVITATAASDIFTQDIEDLPDEVVAEIVGRTSPQSAVAAAAIQQTIPSGPERDAADAEAMVAAKQGVQPFRALWASWPKEKRQLVADLMPKYQQAAEGVVAVAEEVSE